MRILQAVAGLAPRTPAAIAETVTNQSYKSLRDKLQLTGDAQRAQVALITTSFVELSRAAGYGSQGDVHGGALRRHVEACLTRLAGVTVGIDEKSESGRFCAGWQLIAFDGFGTDGSRDIRIVLNPRSSACALKTRAFTHLDLRIARELKGSVARLLHQRLSALTDRKGPPRPLKVTTMMGYAWNPNQESKALGCDGEAVQEGAIRKRRFLIKQALKELDATGWSIGLVPDRPDTRLVKQLTPREYEEKAAKAPADKARKPAEREPVAA